MNAQQKSYNKFPSGLRVLVVDDNISYLNMLSDDLRKCKYKVTETTNATKVLELLWKGKDDYDIIIIEAKMLNFDFNILKIITSEINIPVIMVSENNDHEIVMKCVQNGAIDYLVKPVRIEELQNIWQHVIRKKMVNTPITESQNLTNGRTDIKSGKKRRIIWSEALQEKFINAVNELGSDAAPKKILDMLDEPRLTRTQVSSHLQKYRYDSKKGPLCSSETDDLPIRRTLIQQNHIVAMPSPASASFQQTLASTSNSTPKSFVDVADVPFQTPPINNQNYLGMSIPTPPNSGQKERKASIPNPLYMASKTSKGENLA